MNVTKSYLPKIEDYFHYVRKIWENNQLTNNGELVKELESNLKKYLDVENLLYCSNGTIVLQMAIKALELKGEIITTPFSYVATTNAILWENCKPVYVDIDKDTYCINADKIENSINKNTTVILATHVFGNPCDVDKIDVIAKKYNLKVIYDGAHCFGAKLNSKSLLDYGDISTCSFHATKIFHTIEGGCLIVNDKKLTNKLKLLRQFGHVGDNYYSIGINAKNSEFHAAMGLCILPHMDKIINKRKYITELYKLKLNKKIIPNFNVSGHTSNFRIFQLFAVAKKN